MSSATFPSSSDRDPESNETIIKPAKWYRFLLAFYWQRSTSEPKIKVSKPKATVSEPEITVSKPKATVSKPKEKVSELGVMISKLKEIVSKPEEIVSKPETKVSEPEATVSEPVAKVSEPKRKISGAESAKGFKFHPELSARKLQCCFICFEDTKGSRAIKVPCRRPTRYRQVFYRTTDATTGDVIDEKYRKMKRGEGGVESDAVIFSRMREHLYRNLGTWKARLPYYGILDVYETEVSFFDHAEFRVKVVDIDIVSN